jgi:taurine dioxygenase
MTPVPGTQRITRAIGAELIGADLRDPSIGDALYRALLEHQVLIVRNADLAPLEMADLGRRLGSLGARHHSYTLHPDCDEVVVLDWHGDMKPDAAEWHADMTYRSSGPFASILQAIIVPPTGGDTLWANLYAVHDRLDAGLRSDLEQLEAVHDMGAFRTPAYRSGGDRGIDDAMVAAGSAVHPVIDHHPATGRPYVNVSESFTRWIIGLSAPESARLLTMLFDLINRPEFHMRLRWEPGTLAIWDNRATQHYAVADYLPDRRVMHRVAVATDTRL